MKDKFLFIITVILVIAAAGGLFYASKDYVSQLLEEPVTTEHVTYDNSAQPLPDENSENLLIYSSLSQDEKVQYNSIYSAVTDFEPSAAISSENDVDSASALLCYVLGDHPEIFWISGDLTYSSDGKITFTYIYNRDEAAQLEARLEAEANALLSNVDLSADDYTVSLGVYNTIVNSVSYDSALAESDTRNPASSTVEDALLKKKAICTGYAKLMQYMLNRAGLRAAYVTGDAAQEGAYEGHAWVLHEMDGALYYSDPTWGDCYEQTADNPYLICHTYFGMTLEDISSDHTLDEMFTPFEATSTADSYYVHEGLYIREYSYDAVSEALLADTDRFRLYDGGIELELRFADENEYALAYAELVDGQEIYGITDEYRGVESTRLNFSQDDRRNAIMIYLKAVE